MSAGYNPSHFVAGHIQYISTVIKDDRKYFRKKYGVQFLLDVIRQYYAACELLSSDDTRTVRVSLLGLVKYYIQKEPTFKEVAAILGFLSSVKEEALVRMHCLYLDGSCKVPEDCVLMKIGQGLTGVWRN
jgi:hypothetical protein